MTTDSPPPKPLSDAEMVELLEQQLARARAGEAEPFAMRFRDKRGTLHEYAVGFDTEEEAASALTHLRQDAGELH